MKHRELLLARITALKARKDQVEGMLNSLDTLKISEDIDDVEDGEQQPERGAGSSSMVDQEKRTSGTTEFVNATDSMNDPRIAAVEDRLR